MSIGIYDADMMTYTLVPFNLQVMKLSAYWKSKREMVLLAPRFEPERNKQYYYIKDWDDDNYPNTQAATNVTYLGHAFSGPQYIPLPEEIERMQPDVTIYSRMEKEIIGDGKGSRNKIWNNMVKAEHCRLSLDGKTVWPQYMSQFKDLEHCKNIMFHDYDLAAIDGAWDAVQNILSQCKKNPRIGMKFITTLHDSNDLFTWGSLHANQTFFSLRFDGMMDTQLFRKWITSTVEKENITILEYNIGPASFTQNDFTEDYLREIFRQIIISRSYRLKMTLIYSDNILIDPQLKNLLRLFNYYQHSMLSGFSEDAYIREVQTDTLYDFAKKSLAHPNRYTHSLNKNEIREVFHWVGEYYPTLFKELYELTYIKLKDGGNI